MKTKHLNKKLQLNKQVVSNLSALQMSSIVGGNEDGNEYDKEKTQPSDNCPTPPTSIEPQASGVITVLGTNI